MGTNTAKLLPTRRIQTDILAAPGAMGPLCGPGGTAFCVLDAALPAVLLVLLAAAGVMARATRDAADKADRAGPARAATAVVYAACGVLGAGHLAWAVYQELQQWPIANVVYDAAFFLLWTAVAVRSVLSGAPCRLLCWRCRATKLLCGPDRAR